MQGIFFVINTRKFFVVQKRGQINMKSVICMGELERITNQNITDMQQKTYSY